MKRRNGQPRIHMGQGHAARAYRRLCLTSLTLPIASQLKMRKDSSHVELRKELPSYFVKKVDQDSYTEVYLVLMPLTTFYPLYSEQ